VVAATPTASSFTPSSSPIKGTQPGEVRQPFQADPNVARPSPPDHRSGQAGKPDLPPPRRIRTALAWAGAAAVVLCGIVIIIRDEKGNEKVRLKLDKKDTIEIVNDESDSKPATPTADAATTTADAATPKKIVIGPPVPRPPMVPLDLKPLPIDIKPGSPMSPCALVARPAPLDSVLSWTIELRQPRGGIWGLAYNPDGTLFASGGDDHVVRIWDAKSYALVKVFASGSTEEI